MSTTKDIWSKNRLQTDNVAGRSSMAGTGSFC